MAADGKKMEDALIEMLKRQMEQDLRQAMVLLDGMVHVTQAFGIPSNVLFIVLDSYIIGMRARLKELYGDEAVAEMEKGAAEGAAQWWKLAADKKKEAPPKVAAPPSNPEPKKDRDSGPDYIA